MAFAAACTAIKRERRLLVEMNERGPLTALKASCRPCATALRQRERRGSAVQPIAERKGECGVHALHIERESEREREIRES